MNLRFVPLLLVLSLAACAKSEAPADAASATNDAPAAVANANTPPPPPPGVDSESAAIVANAAKIAAGSPPPIEGVDYIEIPNGQPFDPANGQVEVVEVFGYVCPACNMFQPVVRAWKAQLPANVRFTYVPAQFGGTWDRYARAYYAADALGLVPRTHDLLYNAIHLDRTLKGERGEDSVQDIAAFYARFGADPQQFASTMSSFAIDGKMRKAKQFMSRVGIEGTPTLVIDGKYRVKGKTREDELRIANQLIAQELAALGAK
ncbi:MAG TPA: thiol:disulfide interchange protein DsbA/DsbL [Lysobacter sp.]|nr:thiol:disulfide interchange protein DsbA/DsbL [Lysobacter sp.]